MKHDLIIPLVLALLTAPAATAQVVLDPVPGDTAVTAAPPAAKKTDKTKAGDSKTKAGAADVTADEFTYKKPIDYTLPAIQTTGATGRHVVLSREQCLSIALQDNLTVKVADLEITRMDLAKKETRAALFPTIDFTGAYQRAIELQTMSMSMGGQTQSIKMGRDNTWNFGFSATLPLVAPTLWKALSISDTQILANYEQARSSRLDLINQINKAYYTLLLAKAGYEVVKENYDVAVYNADIYAKQFSVGTATEYDVLRSSVQVKNIEPELLQSQIAIEQAQLQLRVLMGIADDIAIEPDVTLSDMQRDMYDYVAGLDRSLTGNSSLRSLDIQTRLANQNVELKKFAFLPTLASTFSINWNAMSNGNALKNQEFHPYSTVGLALSVPIFSGGSRYYGLKQAQVQVRELQLQRENLVHSLTSQVDLAIDNIRKEVKQIDTSAEGVRQAEKAHEIMQKSFDIGAATYLNLRDSELARTTAKLAYLQAIYNYLISTSELDLLLGREDQFHSLGYSFP